MNTAESGMTVQRTAGTTEQLKEIKTLDLCVDFDVDCTTGKDSKQYLLRPAGMKDSMTLLE